MVLALFVFDAKGIAVMAGEPATCEDRVGLLPGYSEHDERSGRHRRVATQPLRVGGADRRGQGVGRAEDFNSAVFAVVSSRDSEVGLLVRGQGIADAGDGLNELIPADLLA